MALVPANPGAAMAVLVHRSEEEKRVMDELDELERDVAIMGVDVQRNHEFVLREIYRKRHCLFTQVPDFWCSIFMNPPRKFSLYVQQDDYDLLQHVTKFYVERHEISEDGESGDPRSLRFIFNFAPNQFIENHELVKVLEYRQSKDGQHQGFTSEPVHIRWKSRDVDLTKGTGHNAFLLWQAEKAIQQYPLDEFGKKVTREELFQHQRVLDSLREIESSDREPSFFNWFYFRGIDLTELGETEEGNGIGKGGMLKAEVFPEGERVADYLAEKIWINALDLYNESLELESPEPELEPEDAMMLDPENMPPPPRKA